jgi:hypothetical protein
MPRVELTGGFYEDSAKQFDAQTCVNMFAEFSEGGPNPKGRASLKGAFGHEHLRSTLVSTTNSEMIGIHSTSGGSYIFISVDGAGFTKDILIYDGNLNLITSINVTSVSGFSAADNGKVIFVSVGNAAFFFDFNITLTATLVTDPDFIGAFNITYKDTYFLWVTGTTSGESRMYISDNFATDPSNFVNALDFTTIESNPDSVVTINTIGNDVVVFSTETIEFYYNSGNVDFPFERNSGVTLELGTIASDAVSKINNSIIFIGTDSNGSYIVYILEGYTPRRVSNHAIEKRLLKTGGLPFFRSYSYQKDGSYFYVLQLGNGEAIQYCLNTSLWNDLDYTYLQGFPLIPFGSFQEDSRPNVTGLVSTPEGHYIDVAILSGSTYTYLARDDGLENVSIKRIRTMQHLTIENKNIQYNSFEMDIQKGVGNVDDPDPEITLSVSRDGGMTYGNPRTLKMGASGAYKGRVKANMLGMARDAVFKIESDSPVQQEWFTAYVDYEVESE